MIPARSSTAVCCLKHGSIRSFLLDVVSVASGSLRMGVAEMTRFGMGPEDFGELAELIRDVVVDQAIVQPRVEQLRSRFLDMKYCFDQDELAERLNTLHDLA